MSRSPKLNWSHVFIAITLFAILLLGSGCSDQKKASKTKTARPEVTLKILAVDSPSLVNSAARLWSAEGQGGMEITEISLKEFSADEFEIASQYDVVVYPCSLMAELVANDQLIELPMIDLEGEVLDRNELLPHQRKKLLYYGSKVWSIPLGSPQLMLMYDKSTFTELDLSPPETWSEFEAVAETLKTSDKRVTLPLQDDWAAELFSKPRCLFDPCSRETIDGIRYANDATVGCFRAVRESIEEPSNGWQSRRLQNRSSYRVSFYGRWIVSDGNHLALKELFRRRSTGGNRGKREFGFGSLAWIATMVQPKQIELGDS